MAYVILMAGLLVIMTSFAMMVALRLYARHRQQFEMSMENTKSSQERMALQNLLLHEETERKRIGRDLHDQVAGDLVVLQMELNRIKSFVTQGNSGGASGHLHDAGLILKRVMGSTRNISNLLNPVGLMKYGFSGGLWELVNRANNVSDDIQFRLSIPDQVNLSKFQELVFYRIVQELINNAFKHSKASVVQMNFKEGITMLLSYEDNGIGIINDNRRASRLESLYSRVESLNGEIDVVTLEKKGLCITIKVNHDKQ
mgnify:CR=1 FL=1